MKPDWKDAPEWALWLAMDKTGTWYWYEKKPEPTGILRDWNWRNRRQVAYLENWDKTLEPRPKP
jgi:hypothetical protein